MSHAIDKCTQFLDAPMVEHLVPPLEELMKKGLGVATKAGCARLVSSLVSTLPDLLTPHAAKLVKTMVGLLFICIYFLKKDRNSRYY